MIIVGGDFVVDPGQREAFIAGRAEVMRASRAEAGCLEYVFGADPIDPSRVVLFERWESQSALDAHLAGMRGRPRSDQPAVPVERSSITLYDVAGERKLG